MLVGKKRLAHTNITTRDVLGISFSYAFLKPQNHMTFRKRKICHMIYGKIYMYAHEATF